MPIYSYQCDNCDYEFDIFQHFSDETLTECPKCHKEPATGYQGFIPYDPMRAFFTLALMKLLQGASK